MKKYNVLWIDDEHESFEDAKAIARDENIDFHAFKSLNKGIGELEKNYTFYDGIILDAKIYENEDDSPGSEDNKYSIKAKERIDGLGSKKKFEIFLYTGQAEKFEEETFSQLFKNSYIKGDEKQFIDLLEAVKKSADKLDDTQLKHQYQNVLSLSNSDGKYLKDAEYDRIFRLIKELNSKEQIKNTEDSLTSIRKVVEGVFYRFNEIGIIPDEIIGQGGWINRSSRFLADMDSDFIFRRGNKIIPDVIIQNIHHLLKIIQDGSHGYGNLNMEIDKYLKSMKVDYLYKSCILMLFDLLIWFKDFIDEYPNPEENKNLWKSIDEKEKIRAIIQKDKDGNYFDGDYVFHRNFVESNNQRGAEVYITNYSENTDSSTKGKYKYYVSRYEIIN